jgi:hypothetical protein
MATAIEVSQMTIGELAEFTAGLTEALRLRADAEKLRPAVEESLSAECVQCAIRVNGGDLLKLGEGDTENNSKLERLKSGYCARNGCDSLFYRVTRAPHPQIDWPKLLHPAQEIVQTKTETGKAQPTLARMARRHRNILRTAAIIAALLVIVIVRQFYMGGAIPFIREPEAFQVDRGVSNDGR